MFLCQTDSEPGLLFDQYKVRIKLKQGWVIPVLGCLGKNRSRVWLKQGIGSVPWPLFSAIRQMTDRHADGFKANNMHSSHVSL